MSNTMYNRIKYIYWAKEAKKIVLSVEDMKQLLKDLSETRHKVTSNTLRADFTEDTYKIDKHGDYYEVYLYDKGNYYIFSTNALDTTKNINNQEAIKVDRAFEEKFREKYNTTLRRAFGFVDKTFKRCIPKQFYYLNKRLCGREIIASSIDASSQYPSGCLGKLPDSHTMVVYKGKVEPTAEYPFAFYKSGHCAEYGVFDTHNWIDNKFFSYLFRLDNDEYCFKPLNDEDEETILMKASDYEMTDIWQELYDTKNSAEKDSKEYNIAKLIMNKTIGCWHRKDKNKKRCMSYEDHGSYQLAHIVAIAIGRGNQKILNKIKEIGEIRIAHVCVDGIIYAGSDIQGINESKLGVFAQEFTGCKTVIKDINVYAAEDNNGNTIKFKHGSFDLIDGKEFEDNKMYSIKDLDKLGRKERIGDIVNG